ncbi:MAG: hypothetical protein EOO62_38365 [Hymenobacter sp.]|nr:MAG: hypothetical protein EOO62_38365 [Hymenobacter sp.]
MVLVYQCLVMTLPVLKLMQVPAVSKWSWFLITLPIWAPSALLAVVLGVEKVAQLTKGKAASPAHSLVSSPAQ